MACGLLAIIPEVARQDSRRLMEMAEDGRVFAQRAGSTGSTGRAFQPSAFLDPFHKLWALQEAISWRRLALIIRARMSPTTTTKMAPAMRAIYQSCR